MQLWIDGDSWPKEALEIVCDFGRKENIMVNVVADRSVKIGADDAVRMILLEQREQVADNYILVKSVAGDVIFTMDLELARRLIESKRAVVNHQGRIWQLDSIEKRIEDSKIMRAMQHGGMIHRQDRLYSYGRDLSLALKSLVDGSGRQ